MQIIQDQETARAALQKFMRSLKKSAAKVTADIRWRGRAWEGETYWNQAECFWFSFEGESGLFRLRLGLREPADAAPLEPVCELAFDESGADGEASGLLLRFGSDVLLAYAAPVPLVQFLGAHEYDFTVLQAVPQQGEPREALVISSAGADTAPAGVARFVRAVRDFQAWKAQGLLPADGHDIDFGPSLTLNSAGRDLPSPRLLELATRSLREQLDKFSESRNLGHRTGYTRHGQLVLADAKQSVAAVFQVEADLDPANLQEAVGRLILSRLPLHAARFLALPGTLGAFFTQALHRHGIHVLTYKHTQDMSVVFDAEAVFDIVRGDD
ncbi:hypothetical protein [Fundidesulfovibrio agrisoli]|uniref:hypothetical protein n=1 Tax=Fundidesulfovibrio agrisoli TaxID=2922717 RepID=UPI001FAD801B|nr:hypothetical protein [Fundidesulfovibrio agrisoli]